MKFPVAASASLPLTVAPMAAASFAGMRVSANVPTHVVEQMRLIAGKPGWQKITNASWTVHKGQTETVQIVRFDDGTAPLMGKHVLYTTVKGTINGKELVIGMPVAMVSDVNIANTFTVPGLGFNMPIPVAQTGGHVVATADIVAKKSGTSVRHCYAPCRGGTNGFGGAMSTMNWMTSKVIVK